MITEPEVSQVEKLVSAEIKKKVKLRAWSRAELVVTDRQSSETGAFLESQMGKSIFLMDEKTLKQRMK